MHSSGPPVDVMLCPINMNTLTIAEAIEPALRARGLRVGYLRVTSDLGHTKWFGAASQRVRWTTIRLGVDLEVHEVSYALHMWRALRHLMRHDLRRHFRLFAPFIDSGWHPRIFSIALRSDSVDPECAPFKRAPSPLEPRPHIYPGVRHRALRLLKRAVARLCPPSYLPSASTGCTRSMPVFGDQTRQSH